MKYRVITDLYLSRSGIDLKAPAEFDAKDHPELTAVVLESLTGSGVIESLQAEKSSKAPKEITA